MYNFFANIGSTSFNMFGPFHIMLISITVICAILIYFFKDRLKKFKYKEELKYVFATILLLNMVVYYLGLICTNTFNIKEDLPFHLCFITNFFMIYIMYTSNKKLYRIIYFFTFIGPLPAIIWSDLKATYDTCEFWQFILSHHFMILTSIYLLFVLEYKVKAKDMIPSFIIGVIYIGIMTISNNIFGTNYVMLTSLPDNIQKMYPLITKIAPIIPLFTVGVVAFLLSYIPAYIANREQKIIN